jgi:hypothetical protein
MGSLSPLARLQGAGLRVLAILLAGLLAAGAAMAQPPAEPDAIDPPGRVGSVTLLAGPVTMVDLSNGNQEDALLNWPVTGGWRIDAGRGGRAEVRIGSTALRLDEETTVDFVRLDDHFMQIAVLRGSVALRLRNPEILRELELLTQRERIVFDQVGRYRIDVDRPPGLTAVSVFTGSARLLGGGSSFVVAAGQRGELYASPTIRFQIAAAAADRFDDWAAARDAREETIASADYVSRETTGVEMLDQYGDWWPVEEYGAVWFPRVADATWAPYRFGRWVWVSPWGWTWVDEAPWGFAPLHYGRWVVVGGAWGWVPGVVVARPVYAPALVAWYSAPGVRVGAPVGWFPLGPREPYVPAFRHSPRFLRVVNAQHLPNVEPVTIVQTPRYVNRDPGRSTWVPDDRFGRPEPVQRAQRPPPSEWRQYIARPQPPANVPFTKRRQAVEGGPVMPAPSPGLSAPADRLPPVRPPMAAPRQADAPRLPETPRSAETPRDRPAFPIQPRQADAPRSPEAPRSVEVPRDRPAFPVQPRQADAPQLPEAPRPVEMPRDRPAFPVQPRQEPGAGRGEPPGAPRDDRRMSPRAPMPSAPPVQPAAPAATDRAPARAMPAQPMPPAAEVPPFHPRGDGGTHPRDGQRHGPRAPAAPAEAQPPQGLPAPVAPPASTAPAARDLSPAPPPTRPAIPERSPRPGRSAYE